MQRGHLTVGNEPCDIRGFTHTHIQCAVDRLAFLGGGTVELSAGVFQMADALHLRTGVTVRGQGETTVLRKNAMKTAKITSYLGYGHYDVIVDQPDRFQIGEGISIRDDNAFGFYTTVGTLVARDGDTWFTNRPHSHDYHNGRHALVETLFPIVEAYDVEDAVLEGLVIDGNREENPVTITGCRGGGVFTLRSNRLKINGVAIRNLNADGFSFQTGDDIEIANCLAEGCTGHGFHPGSGSNRFHVHHCRSIRNRDCGLFYCLRVRDGLLEDCVFEGNGSHGISIGNRDTGHRNRRLTIRANGGCGVFFRPDEPINSPHGNVIEACLLENNCVKNGKDDAEIVLNGAPDGVQLLGNTIRRTAGRPGILIRPDMPPFLMKDNRIEPDGADAVLDLREKG
ncbi:MAG: right-handed parallel beta-helix repeat-containing protein [Lentisphaerae bacterium]|nr:right-handed parallel beta-helix repeat-containing protein [Lentisphaerota bacterium]